MSKEYPKCQICGQEMANGYRLRRKWKGEDLYLCEGCQDLIHAVAHDSAFDVFDDIRSIMGEADHTWKEQLEPWQFEEGGEK